MLPDRWPMKMSDDNKRKILLTEEWYNIIEPAYRHLSDGAFDLPFDVVGERLVDATDEVFGFIHELGAFGVWFVTTVVSVILWAIRNGFEIGMFRYNGGFDYSFPIVFGGPRTEELV